MRTETTILMIGLLLISCSNKDKTEQTNNPVANTEVVTKNIQEINNKGTLKEFQLSIAENFLAEPSEENISRFSDELTKVSINDKKGNAVGKMNDYFLKYYKNKSLSERQALADKIYSAYDVVKEDSLKNELNYALITAYSDGNIDTKIEDEGLIFEFFGSQQSITPFDCTYVLYEKKWYLFPPLSVLNP